MKHYLIIDIKDIPKLPEEISEKYSSKNNSFIMKNGVSVVGNKEIVAKLFFEDFQKMKDFTTRKVKDGRKITRVSFDEKVSFVKEYNNMFANLKYADWNTGRGSKSYPSVKRIANNARSRFGYSEKTGDADIVGRLMDVWLKIK